jgi:RNA-directed DNA polymerase
LEGNGGETLSSPTLSTKLQRIAEQAVDKTRVFTTLAHLIDEELLREAYRLTRKDGATGIDGQTGKAYAEQLDANLRDLHERLRSQKYVAPPVRRVRIPKASGGERPIGITTFEDKVVQRAVVMLLSAIYERDFYRFS